MTTHNALTVPGADECRTWVVGLGSPFGDDRAGWDVVARLCEFLPPGAWAETFSDPLRILDRPPGCEQLVVIDASRGAGPPGSIHRFEWPDDRLRVAEEGSSHAVGLASALELAGTLGRLPQRVIVFAVEGTSAEPGAGLSECVAAAVPEIAALVRAEVMPG